MRTLTPIVIVLILILWERPLLSQSLFINEFLASNSTVLADEYGGFDDWVEIYNAASSPVDIGGMYVTDDLTNPTKWQIPGSNPTETTIPAGGFLLLWFDGEPAQGPLHVDTKLSAGGEDIGLFAVDGTQLDALTFGPQTSNVSYGRSTDGGPAFQFFPDPTPGETNAASTGSDFAEAPAASVAGGFYSATFAVELTTPTANAKIRYTLDGSAPADTSALYSTPLTIDQTTTLRARAFAPGLLPSPTATFTYLLENSHTFPVVALSFNDADFFDPATGIYPNFLEDWERPVHVAFFETDGSLVLDQDANVEIQGTGSAQLPQKSLRLEALANGGSGYFQHPVFPDKPFDKYERFVLRNSGQDWNVTMFRDAMVASLSDNLSDVGNIISPPKLYHQAFRPGVVYLNGKYWGIHNLREHMKSEYIEQHFGLSDNEIDLLDNDEVDDGSADNWNALTEFLLNNSLADDANLTQFGQMMDLPHFLDYSVYNVIVDASDWPGNNFRRWRDKNNGLWRFLTFDLDFTFGLFNHVPGGPTWNTGDASANSLARLLDDSQSNWPNPSWVTLYFRKPMENEHFRRDFINRTADMLNVLFDPARVNERIDEFEAMYLPEIQRHMDRWNTGWNPFTANVELLRQFANERPQYVQQHVIDAFAEVTGTANITLQTDPAGAGRIQFSTLNLNAGQMPWSGEYFTGVDIPVTVVPAPGYVFEGWSDADLGTALSTKINLSGDLVLTAHFTQSNTPVERVVINEINYNSPDTPNSGDWLELYNPNNQTVDLSDWTLEDSNGEPFTIPAGTLLPPDGYLVLVENKDEFTAVYPAISAVIGNFGDGPTGFKFSNNSELIILRNASQVVIDSVRYDDEAPWPPAADGDGPTLQLIDPGLDNALPQSWIAQEATPGQVNLPAQQPQTIDFPLITDKLTTDQPFLVTASATSGLPVSFEIVSGPASVSGNIITLDGTVGLVFVKATQPGDSQWEAAPPVTRAFRINEPVLPAEYCGALGQKPWLEWIMGVTFADLNHVSGKSQYSDFTSLTANVGTGELVALSVEPRFSWQTFDEHIRVWIDFNQDYDFDDPGEMVLEEHGSAKVSTNVLIPLTAKQGATRMRVAMQRGQYAMPCDTFTHGEVEDYTVYIGDASLASQSIDFPPIPDQVATAPPFFITAMATSGLPVSFTVVSGPASVLGNTVTLTGASGTVTIRAAQAGDAQWQAALPVTRSFVVNYAPAPPTPPGTYCNSSGEQPWHEWIERVEFGSIDHFSFKEPYGDFTDVGTDVSPGETILLRISPKYSWEVFEEYFRVWIDFNQDADFDDPGEMVLEAIGTATVTADVTIPPAATPGATRMRVSMQRGQFADPCENFLIGEVHDYEVVISDSFNGFDNDGRATQLNLRIAPNPTDDRLNATFNLVREGEAKLTIINGNGVVVYAEKRHFPAGSQQFSHDVSNLKSGMYMLFVQPERQKAMTGRFMKVEE